MDKQFGRPPIQLTESQIRYAMENSFGNKAAARFLNIDYRTYKKYAKMYIDSDSGKTLFDLHIKIGVKLDKPTKEKHWQGKSFDCNKGYKEKLEDILDGKYPGYNSRKLRKRLLLSPTTFRRFAQLKKCAFAKCVRKIFLIVAKRLLCAFLLIFKYIKMKTQNENSSKKDKFHFKTHCGHRNKSS
jgi:hypothetical protein